MRKWMRRLAVALLALVLVGALVERVCAAVDARRFPPPGQLVDIGGRRIHMRCTGTRGPTVVLDAGWGDFSLGQTLVQAGLGDQRACSFDRAGYGWSDDAQGTRDAAALAEDERRALLAANVAAPWVLVAHSSAGLTARVFAGAHRDEIAGLVFVDADHPDAAARLPHLNQGPMFTPAVRLAYSAACHLGITRALLGISGVEGFEPAAAHLPTDVQRMALAHLDAGFFAAAAAEERAFDQSAAEARRVTTLGDLPVVVLAALADKREDRDAWLALQRELAALSTRAELRVLPDAGHLLPLEHPDAVVAAIHAVLAR
jgi:pimeloyl-ACP methyl ester carboxylesterase